MNLAITISPAPPLYSGAFVVAVKSGDSRIVEDLPPSRPRTLRTAVFHPPVPNSDEVMS
jgi:hypothetical protein